MVTLSTVNACKSSLRDRAICCAPAKLNLTLAVGGRRPDGYHEIDTVMAAVDLFDEVAVMQTEAPGISVSCDDPEVPRGRGNLAYRAAEVLADHAGVSPGLHIEISKRIPAGSGLGGGSSDAAATIKALDYLWGLNWPTARLARIGAEVGSDVPFFFYTPAARCRGRGEQVRPLDDLPRFWAVLVFAGLNLPTAQVYQAFDDEQDRRAEGGLHWPAGMPAADLTGQLFNVLEGAAVRVAPELGSLWGQVEACGRRSFRLAGSGSSLFCLQDRRDEAETLASALADRLGVRAQAVRSCAW